MSHTPGPWAANELMVVAAPFVGMYGGKEVCHCGGNGLPVEVCLANARLMAAAPDLLAMCEWAISHIDTRKTNLIANMKAAIAKAKPETESCPDCPTGGCDGAMPCNDPQPS